MNKRPFMIPCLRGARWGGLSRVFLLAFLALGAAPAPAGAPVELFHASFDRTADLADRAFGDAREVPRSHAVYRERSRGTDVGLAPGRFGMALTEARAFDAHGNVPLPRGTLSFWFRQGDPVDTMYYPILELRTVEQYFWWRFLSIHGMHGKIRVELVDRDCLRHMLTLPDWEVGEWQHLAVVWDHAQGMIVYRNGEPAASNWGETSWAVGRMHFETIELPASRSGAYDEVRIFSAPLNAEQVRALFEENRFDPDAGDAQAAVFRPELRIEELGWEQRDAFPLLRAGEPLVAASVPVNKARQLKRWVWRGIDGKEGTFFPSNYQGYRFLDGGGYHLAFAGGRRIDLLRITGRFRGDLFAGDGLHPPPAGERLTAIEPVGFVWQQHFDPPLEQDAVSFFRRPLEGERGWWVNDNEAGSVAGVSDRRARMRNLQAFSLDRGRPAKRFDTTIICRPGTEHAQTGTLPAWFSEALVSLYDEADRGGRLLFRDHRYAWEDVPGLSLPALRAVHLFSPEADTSSPSRPAREDHVDAVSFAWTGRVEQPTALRMHVRDPLTPRRELVSFDVRLEPGEGRYELMLDHPGIVVPQGRIFWITLHAEHALQLDGFEVRFHLREAEEVRAQYAVRQRGWMRDLFMYMSEGRPWGRVETWGDAQELGRMQRALGEMYDVLAAFRRQFPDDGLARGIDIWTRPNADHPRGEVVLTEREAEAPAWAAYARSCLAQFLEMAHWWVENRQVETGEFGSNIGDDSCLVQDWPSLSLISDPEGVLRESLGRVAERAWQERIRGGLNARSTDTLHAYEEGINLMPHHAMLEYGNPVYVTRLMESARAVRENLMDYTDGHLHFRSWWYGADRVVTEGRYGVDGPWNSLMLHPTIWLAWYGGYPFAVETLSEYARAWLEDFERFEPANLQMRIHFERHEPSTQGAVNTYGFNSLLNAVHDLAEQPDVRGFLLDRGNVPLDFIEMFRNEEVFPADPSYLERARAVDLGPLRTQAMSDDRFDWMYLGWWMTRDTRFLEDGARRLAERTSITLPMQTMAEQSADRVMLSKKMIERMYLGGVAAHRNDIYPRHAVSYEGMGPEFAALVSKDTASELDVQFYNFAGDPLEGRMRVWNLVPGTYEVRYGPWDEARGRLRRTSRRVRLDLKRYEPVPLDLPPGRLWGVTVRLLEPGVPLHERADLALAAAEGVYDAQDDTLTVRVHNLGTRPSGEYTIRIRDAEGRDIESRRLPSLDAPADLQPRTVDVRFEGLGARGLESAVVELDPEGRIEEVTEVNNRAVFDLRK